MNVLRGGRDRGGQDPKCEIMLSGDDGEEDAEDFICESVCFDYLSRGLKQRRGFATH